MNKIFFLFAIISLALTSTVRAEPIPDYVLDKDYSSCMGGTDAAADAARDAYCNCVRDGMRSWDLESYANIALEQSKSANPQAAPPKIEELAKECIAKVLK